MNDHDERLHAQAKAAQTFLVTIGTSMIDLELDPRVVIGLFGKFTERLVEHEAEASGRERAEVMASALNAFATGLGMTTMVKRVDGEAAEQLRAEFEKDEYTGPLQ